MHVNIKEIRNRDFKEQNTYFSTYICDSMDFLKVSCIMWLMDDIDWPRHES
jgi:hypothetical protein